MNEQSTATVNIVNIEMQIDPHRPIVQVGKIFATVIHNTFHNIRNVHNVHIFDETNSIFLEPVHTDVEMQTVHIDI